MCDAIGAEAARRTLGANATGLPFNSVEAVERSTGGRTNPLVNSGAIATIDLVAGFDHAARWEVIRAGLSRFAGRELILDDETYASAAGTNHRNRALAQLLQSLGALTRDPDETVDLYTRQSCLAVTARDLAMMGATLADGGVNPSTGVRVVSSESCRYALTVMTTAGLYETSGDWLYQVGLPGKSGIGGGIVAVSPGKGGLGTFSPRSTTQGTASVASSPPPTCPAGSGWTSSRRPFTTSAPERLTAPGSKGTNPMLDAIPALLPDLGALYEDLHAHPELVVRRASHRQDRRRAPRGARIRGHDRRGRRHRRGRDAVERRRPHRDRCGPTSTRCR